MTLPVVLIHGGATVFEEKDHPAIISAVQNAAKRAMCVLENGGSSLDAVESAIWVLEETTLFTAGRGACLTSDGEVEVDAIIMDGNRLQSGAVMAAKDIVHPISLARYVLERTSVSQVAGMGVTKLYNQMLSSGYRKEFEPNRTRIIKKAEPCDTVGALAVDEFGRIAAGSSTSGWPGKLSGRVGDSPVIGSGLYANEVAGACCTGKGEQILRIVMGRMAVLYVEQGMSVQEAAIQSMNLLKQKTSGEAGLIMVDSSGHVSLGFDTTHMPVALIKGYESEVYSSMKPVLS
ncbi:MAG: hypothetical protein GF411_03360 [Candidatus Lokiarchaeota archaeon]|nr:hypothetical protein [Candidatus Lokiarchaeota archaeon]